MKLYRFIISIATINESYLDIRLKNSKNIHCFEYLGRLSEIPLYGINLDQDEVTEL